MGDLHERSLVRLAKKCEEAANGLHSMRDNLPRNANSITGSIGRIFNISSQLQDLDQAQGDEQYAASFYLIHNDLAVLRPTLEGTMDTIFEMFGSTLTRSYLAAWEAMTQRMDQEEGEDLFQRLGWYQDFLKALFEQIDGQPVRNPTELRRALVQLTERQEYTARKARRQSAEASAPVTPRPNIGRPRASRGQTPRSPTSSEGSARPAFMPFAPEPPPFGQEVPLSPTSSTSQTFNSSQTSYSSDFMPPQLSYVHWSQRILVGDHPNTPFSSAYQLRESSQCHGDDEYDAVADLLARGFNLTLEVSFNRGDFSVRLYWRLEDSRACILILTKDRYGRERQYCEPLVELKVIRNASSLQICKLGRRSGWNCWAQLNFFSYERMVLFYCTFVAMKRQDSRPVPHDALLDENELRGPEIYEDLEFAGDIRERERDRELIHVLRIWRDRTSGVCRLETTASRGPMRAVPLWTAFVTRYAVDPDHVQREGPRVVSLVALRPGPYVFVHGYRPRRNEQGEYVLEFTSTDDASHFMETWAGLARQV